MILAYSIKNMMKKKKKEYDEQRYITDLQKGKLGKNLKFLSSEILRDTPRILKYKQRNRKMGPKKNSGN